MKTTAEDYLAQAPLLRLLGVLALVVVPHVIRMALPSGGGPAAPWIAIAVIALGLWRALVAMRQWPLPPTWLKVTLVVVAILAHQITYGRVNGQHAGAALLVLMLALKLTEMRSRRDVLVVVSLCYFTMGIHFLFSQELWTILYLFGCAVAVTAMLIEATHAGGAMRTRVALRKAAAMTLQAIPLMVLLFILFPRVPGPIWGLPADAGAARTGIADTMSPGDISQLVQSDAVAFRVQFDGEPPPMKNRYWRGPVLWYFDGRRWRAPFRGDDYFRVANPATQLNAYEQPVIEALGDPVRYDVMLEPHRQNFLFALDLPSPEALPPGTALTGYAQLLSRELVKDTVRYQAVSFMKYRLEPELDERWQKSGTRLPDGGNPRTVALAQGWRAEGLGDEQVIERALRMFRTQDYYYTLEPPTLGGDMVDEFLFETKRGFCEHYAGAFTVLMRAAGIPARVVVGYQGGELNDVGDYYVVRQSDAHAWSEVWLAGRGWVRVDPTAAVAPSRVETGISSAVAESELPSFLRRGGGSFFRKLRLSSSFAWDWVNVMWDRWVLGWNPEKQFEFLRRFGLDDWGRMVMALTILVTVVMSVFGWIVMRQVRPATPADEPLRLWRRATRILAGKGLPQAPYEGPRDYAERVMRERPDLAPVLKPLLDAYLKARYLDVEPRRAEAELATALKTLAAV